MHTTLSWSEFEAQIQTAHSVEQVDALELEIFGRKQGAMTAALAGLRDLSPDEKKERAKELNEWKMKLEAAIADRKRAMKIPSNEKLAAEDPLDVTLTLPQRERGHLHLIPEFIREVEEVFGRMGFDTAYGPEVETEEHNFDFLNFPKDHAARDAQDVFYLDLPSAPDNRWLLRAHTSPVQIRYMRTHKPPFRMICPGKVYRKDADATHSPMFHQFEGLMIGKDVSIANMKAVMIQAVQELIGGNAEFRFRTGYFPFVEPGLELDMRWQGTAVATAVPGCAGTTELAEHPKEGRWLEIAGCGMVHPNVLNNVGIDPDEWQGFAFGFGVERMLMIRHQIPDLRSFYEGDLRFLRQF